jgi:hypothetical protein
MNKKNKTLYGVFVEWYYGAPEESYEHCIISVVDESVLQQDGSNMIGHAGNEGYHFDVYDRLDEAIINANFNPTNIKFEKFSDELLKEAQTIISKYDWDYEKGLIYKGD